MENQTLPLGLGSLWAGAGAKYSWRGVCGCATRFTNEILSSRKNQLYNYTGLDGRSVIMKWYARTKYNGRTLGGYAESRREKKPTDPAGDMGLVVADMQQMCDTGLARLHYPFNVAAAFGYGWDDLSSFVAPEFIKAAKLNTTPSRSVRVSNEVDFFEDIARNFPKLATERVSYGNEWDTYCVSMNETTAKVRRATEKLRTAEALAAVVSLKGFDFSNTLKTLRTKAWEAYGSYWEHDWTADGPVSQKDRANWQIKLQEQIREYVDTLYTLGSAALAKQISSAPGKRFYVFNPLNWNRNDVADIEFDGSEVKVIDVTTGKEAPSQRIVKNGKAFIRFEAENIPSVGYKIFELKKGLPARLPIAALVTGEYIANKYARLRISPSGVIKEWYDSLSDSRSLVKLTDGKYVNDLGTKDLSSGTLTVENAGPVSVTIKAVSTDPLPHTVRITLYAGNPRIEIEDSIQSNFGDLKTWAFSFNLNLPTTHHEELGAILTAKKETRGGYYIAQNGRYDWLTFNHFANLSEKDYGITISNEDCSFFTLGKSTPDSLWETAAQLKALAGGQTDPYTGLSINVKDTVMMGIYRQNGEQHFRYSFALTANQQSFDPLRDIKFSLEHQNPLVTAMITGNSGATGGKNSYSLFSVQDPAVILWSIKPAEEGNSQGLIARLWNFNQQPAKTNLKLAMPIQKAWQTSH
ncbi:MAG: glycoside hydrolase, partial [Saprospiraceae bacterium]